MKLTEMQKREKWLKVGVARKDWRLVPEADLQWMFFLMVLIRRFEETLLELHAARLINGPVHTSVGQEAVAAGMALALDAQDRISGTHRAHHQYLAKVLAAHRPKGYTPLNGRVPESLVPDLSVLMGEIMGLENGCCHGRGGSMHLRNVEAGVAGTNAIVGGGIPHATGIAWADRRQGRENVTVCFFGDGALYQGVFHESANLAAIWDAPIIYFIENNQFAVGTRAQHACSSAPHLMQVGAAYGMSGLLLDGMNPIAVKCALETAVGGKTLSLPCVIEAHTYRFYHHAGGVPGSAFGYRTKGEEAEWTARDCIPATASVLRDIGALDEKNEAEIRRVAHLCVEQARDACVTMVDGVTVARPEIVPNPLTLEEGLPESTLPSGIACVESGDVACEREIRYSDAIAEVTGRWMERDPHCFVLGEEVGNMGGGAYGATKGLIERFPDRIRNTPISEAGFCGLACGAAMNGMRPIVEIMFTSFALVAADQLFNQIAVLRHVYGGKMKLPLIVRTRTAIGLGYGAQHSMEPTALYALFPGWRILAPSNPFDYIGLFNAAMLSETPTVFIEHHSLYAMKGRIPAGAPDHVVRTCAARIVQGGADATVVTHGWGVAACLESAKTLEGEGVHAEIIDLRTLDDRGMDFETIGRSLKKTGALVVVEQAPTATSLGAKIVSRCQAEWFDWFDGPAVRVTAENAPVPVSRYLEPLCIPSQDAIANAIRAAAKRM
jgi:2-oxoisovalerate dehydrogenase E1 component